jgi:hypothetical protein
MRSTITIVAAALLAIGIALSGWFVGQGFITARAGCSISPPPSRSLPRQPKESNLQPAEHSATIPPSGDGLISKSAGGYFSGRGGGIIVGSGVGMPRNLHVSNQTLQEHRRSPPQPEPTPPGGAAPLAPFRHPERSAIEHVDAFAYDFERRYMTPFPKSAIVFLLASLARADRLANRAAEGGSAAHRIPRRARR